MSSDDTVTRILDLIDSEDAGESLCEEIVNHAFALGYKHGLHPSLAVAVAAANVYDVLSAMTVADWDEQCAMLATLLEQRTHRAA